MFNRNARIGFRNHCSMGVIRSQRGNKADGGTRFSKEPRRPFQKKTTVEMEMNVIIPKIDDTLIHLIIAHRIPVSIISFATENTSGVLRSTLAGTQSLGNGKTLSARSRLRERACGPGFRLLPQEQPRRLR